MKFKIYCQLLTTVGLLLGSTGYIFASSYQNGGKTSTFSRKNMVFVKTRNLTNEQVQKLEEMGIENKSPSNALIPIQERQLKELTEMEVDFTTVRKALLLEREDVPLSKKSNRSWSVFKKKTTATEIPDNGCAEITFTVNEADDWDRVLKVDIELQFTHIDVRDVTVYLSKGLSFWCLWGSDEERWDDDPEDDNDVYLRRSTVDIFANEYVNGDWIFEVWDYDFDGVGGQIDYVRIWIYYEEDISCDWPILLYTDPLTSAFGYRYYWALDPHDNQWKWMYGFHRGLDMRASSGTSVYSVFDGKVVSVYPLVVQSSHNANHYMRYVHITPQVSVNDEVEAGDYIAYVSGDHLDVKYYVGDYDVDYPLCDENKKLTRNPMHILVHMETSMELPPTGGNHCEGTDVIFWVEVPNNELDLIRVEVLAKDDLFCYYYRYVDYDCKHNVDYNYNGTTPPEVNYIKIDPVSWNPDNPIHPRPHIDFTWGASRFGEVHGTKIEEATVSVYNVWGSVEASETYYTGVEENDNTPLCTFFISQNTPNPFKDYTEIEYTLPKDSQVKVIIYNIAGQRVKTLIDVNKKAGTYAVHWDGRDDRGEQVAGGVYLYEIKAGDYSDRKKMILLGGVR